MAAVKLPAASNFHSEGSALRERTTPFLMTYNWLAHPFPSSVRVTGRIDRLLCPLITQKEVTY